jgi:hypothetical protein
VNNNKRKQLWPYLAVSAFVALIVLWRMSLVTPEVPMGKIMPQPAEGTRITTDFTVLRPDAVQTSATAGSSDGLKLLESDVPDVSTIRNEVAADPHGLPASLQNFALVMSKHMELALKSENKARAFLPELIDCASDQKNYYPAVRVTCAINGLRLVEQYQTQLNISRRQYLGQMPEAMRQAIKLSELN